MIGDAYFQLRAQVGTALFSLLRLATETGAGDGALSTLRSAQADLRDSLLFLTLGPPGSGKSTLLNTLFDREFCGAVEPLAAEKTAVLQYGEEARDESPSARRVVLHRPHIFLRDFTVVDAAGFAPREEVAPYASQADAIFFVVSATGASADMWEYLLRLGRDALRRTVFVVWQSDRVSPQECTNAVKRLRQAMLKNLGHACPIFAASSADSGGREKLKRWIENEVIFSARRRDRLADLDQLARRALQDIADQPQTVEKAWQRTESQLRGVREDLAEREEQSQRQISGLLWTLAQGFEGICQHGESLIPPRLAFLGFLRKRDWAWPEFAKEIETQARECLLTQTREAVAAMEAELGEAADEHRQACRELLPDSAGPSPPFPSKAIAAALLQRDVPLDLERVMTRETSNATRLLRLPQFALAGAGAVLLGAWPVVGIVAGCAMLTAGAAAFVLVLDLLLRHSLIAVFRGHFTANRAALITAFEPPLQEASAQFYAALFRPLEARMAAHEEARQGHEPLFSRVESLRETFDKFAQELRSERLPGASSTETV